MLFRHDGQALGWSFGHRRPQAESPRQQGERAKANDILLFQALAPSPLRFAVESAGLPLNMRTVPLR
jgi:hypothetical protein